MTEVVAALIWKGDRFLICQRPANKSRGLLWEFVGGKVEPGETKQEALRRECREEMGIDVRVGPLFMELTHVYPDLSVHLSLYICALTGEEPRLLEHAAMAWIRPEEAAQYAFCDADTEILERLRQLSPLDSAVKTKSAAESPDFSKS